MARRSETCPLAAGGACTCLDGIRLFAQLPQEAKDDLVARAVIRHYGRGEVLVSEGDPIDRIVVVRRGRVKTLRTDVDGSEMVLDVLHDGQAIWHGMFVGDQTYHYSVGALTDVDACLISRGAFERTLALHPDAALGLISMLATELVEAEEKAMLLGIREPRRRVARYLLTRERRCLGGEINLKVDDIAASVCLRSETVSRCLAGLERDGLVGRLGRGRLRVLDRQALVAVAEGA